MEYTVLTSRQLGLALKGWRKSRRLTQAAAAGQVGLLPKTISALESDPESSSLGSLFKLLSALDLELVLRPRSKGGPPEARPRESGNPWVDAPSSGAWTCG